MESVYNNILDESLNGFLRISYPDYKIKYINNIFYDLLKCRCENINQKANILDQNIYDVMKINKTNINNQKFIRFLKDAETNKVCSVFDKFILNGKEKYYKFIYDPLYKDGKIPEILIMCFDITDEVQENVKTKEKLKAEEEFFINVTHELKTPLNVIFSINQLLDVYLSKKSLNIHKDNIKRNNNIIKQNCYRLIKLVNNIVDLSKFESGHLKLNLINIDIVKLMEEMVKSVSDYIKDKGLIINFYTDVKEKYIAIDVDKMERIILNLISNAIKFSKNNGKIDVIIRDKKEFIEISIRDYGVGIEQENLNIIFNRFEQVQGTYLLNKLGSGVGLSLVKSIVELHEGEISVESQVDNGSTFTIKIPSKIVDKPAINVINHIDNKIEKINIELSDIYSFD